MSRKLQRVEALPEEEEVSLPNNLPVWQKMQYKSFHKWCNVQLRPRTMTVGASLENGFKDGSRLYNLLEILGRAKVSGKLIIPAKSRIQMIQNNGLSFNYMQREKIRLENVGVEDIVDGNLKLLMGMIWTLILRYQIQAISTGRGDPAKVGSGAGSQPQSQRGGARADAGVKQFLLDWCKCIAHYPGVKITNLTTSFQDGLAFNAMAHLHNNDLVQYETLKPQDKLRNLENAFDILEKEFGVPKMLDPKDMVEADPDEKSVMMYLSALICAFDEYKLQQKLGVSGTDATQSLAYGPGIEVSSTFEPSRFTIEARDRNGKKVPNGGDKFQAKLKAPNGNQIEVKISDNQDGTYTADYHASTPGTHILELTLGGKPVSNSPYFVVVEEDLEACKIASHKWSTVGGPGTQIATTAAPSDFFIQANNKYGNPVKTGGDKFQVKIKSPVAGVPDVSHEIKDNNNGTYTVKYQPVVGGTHPIDVLLGGNSLQGCPFSVPVTEKKLEQDQADPKWSSAFGPGLLSASTTEPASFTIQAKNKYGENMTKGGSNFQVSVIGRYKQPVKSNIKDNGDGTYTVSYFPTSSGDQKVHVSLDGKTIANGLVSVNSVQTTVAPKSLTFGAGTEIGSTAEPAEFIIQAVDAVGNKVTRGGDPFKVHVTSPQGSSIKASVKDKKNGTYVVRYQPTIPGVYVVDTTLHGERVSQNPHKVLVEHNTGPNAQIDPKWTTMSGAGTEIASTAEISEFSVQAKNKYGNNIKRGGDLIKPCLKNPNGQDVPAQIQDHQNGTYTVTYSPNVAGQHLLDLRIADKSQPRPLVVEVEKNQAINSELNPRWTLATGTGTQLANTTSPTEFAIVGRNKYGNLVQGNDGAGAVRVQITDQNGSTSLADEIADKGDGSFSVKYQTKTFGEHEIDVSIDGDLIFNSPLTILSHQITDPKSCTISGGGHQAATIFEPAEFVITARDKNKNLVNRGGDDFKVKVISPKGDLMPVTFKDNNNGTYTVSYQPQSPGTHQIDVSLGGISISDDLLKVSVEEDKQGLLKADAAFSTIYGPQLSSTSEPLELKVQARNKYGTNLPQGGETLVVKVNSPKGSPTIVPEVFDNGDGTYSINFQPKVPGHHVVDVLLDGKSISNAPYTILASSHTNVNEQANAKLSTAFGPGLVSASTTEAAEFTVQACNLFGNPLKKGGSHVEVNIEVPRRSSPIQANVKDNGDGTYSISYQPKAAGEHRIQISLDEKPLGNGTPFTVKAAQKADAAHCVAFGAGCKIASTAEPSEFTIQAKDALGNKLISGGDDFRVKITAPDGSPLKSTLKDNRDGTYSVKYNPKDAGQHQIEVVLDNKPISGAPFKVIVEKNDQVNWDLSPTWSIAAGPGTELASDFEVSEFKIQSKNKYGNDLPFGGGDFNVEINAPDGSSLPAMICDNFDGTYSVSYYPGHPGDHHISVLLKGDPISEDKKPICVPVEHNTEVNLKMDSRWSSVAGGAESASTATPTELIVQAKNKYGNQIFVGDTPLRADVKGSRGIQIPSNVKNHLNGTYAVQFQPTESGLVHVDLFVDNNPVYRTPLDIDVTQGIDPSKCSVFGAGASIASTAEPAEFMIQAVDLAGNKMTRGGDKFNVQIETPEGAAPVLAQVVDKKNGRYQVRYHPHTPGKHVVKVTCNGKPIGVGPLSVNVESNSVPDEKIDSKWTNAHGAGGDIGSTAEKAELVVQSRNKYGNKLKKGGGALSVNVATPDGTSLPVSAKDNSDGTFTVQYQPSSPGDHKISLSLDGIPLQHAPSFVPVESNKSASDEPDPKYTTAYGPGAEAASTSEPAVIHVQTKNKFGNNTSKPGDVIKMSVKSPGRTTKPIKTEVKDNGNGNYTITYQPIASGDHLVDVTMNGVSIYDNPMIVPVTQETDPTKCKAFGAGTVLASTAEPAEFTIQAIDQVGNLVTRGGDKFQVIINDPDGKVIPSQLKDNLDGSYTVQYQPTNPGVHLVDVSLRGVSISPQPFKVDVQRNELPSLEFDPKWTLTDGAGIQLGSNVEKAEFEVQLKNKYGNNLNKNDAHLKISVKAPGNGPELPVDILNKGDGTYDIKYHPSLPGDYDIQIDLDGFTVSKNVAHVDANDLPNDEADPRWSKAFGPGVTKASIVEPTEFTLVAKNQYGNQLNRGGDDVVVRVIGPGGKVEASPLIVDNFDGTYSISYQPLSIGDSQVEVFLNGKQVHKSPFYVPITCGIDAAKCDVFGDGVESGVVGEPAKFTIQAKNKYWGNITSGGENFKVTVLDPNGKKIEAQVQDNNDGSYSVVYLPTLPGYHDVDVSLGNEKVTVLKVPAKQTIDPTKCTIKGLPQGKILTSEPVKFVFETRDKSGGKVEFGGDDVYVKITPPPGSFPVIADVEDLNNGEYHVTFTASHPGEHVISVELNQNPAGNGPFTVQVQQSPADPKNCQLTGNGFTEASTTNPAIFKLLAKDKNGNNLVKGGEQFMAEVINTANSKPIPVEIKDNNDGTYSVSFLGSEPGIHQLKVLLNGVPISDEPYSIPVKQYVEASKCAVSGPGITAGSTSETSQFTIQARDKAGTDVRTGGENFEVKIVDPNGAPIPSTIKDNKDGTYTVSYNPYAPGEHLVNVKLNGSPVGEGLFKPVVNPGKATIMSNFEMELWKELNKARTNPASYVETLKGLEQYFEQGSNKFSIPGTKYARMTKEGLKCLQEAIEFLKKTEPVPPLEISEDFSRSCLDLSSDQGPIGGLGATLSDGTPVGERLVRYGSWKAKVTEIINYGGLTPQDVVHQWIIDDGVSDRANRRSIFDPEYHVAGISSGPHAKHMRMAVVSLAGDYVAGDYDNASKSKERKVHSSHDTFSIERYATPDGKGYLIEGGNIGTNLKKENLKFMKEGTLLHLYKTLFDEDGEPLVSHYRWQIPFDFDPISATGMLNPKGDFTVYLSKPPTGGLDPNVAHEVTRINTVADPEADSETLTLKLKQNKEFVLADINPGQSNEDVTITIKNNVLGLICNRVVVGRDEEGEFKQTLTEERNVKLPFPVPMSSFFLETRPATEDTPAGFVLKIAKPTTKPDQQNVELPVLFK